MTAREIQQACARHYEMDVSVILERGKGSRVANPRSVAMYLVRELMQLSYPEVGRIFRRDHSTVIHACRRVAADVKLLTGAQTIRMRLVQSRAPSAVCATCGQLVDRVKLVEGLKEEHKRLAARIAALEASNGA